MAAAVGQPGMDGAAAAGLARYDTADRAELHKSASLWRRRGTLAARLTLVTLDCRPFDIMKSVAGGNHEELPAA